ncbi:mesothelin [Pontoporia blainvillei]|uniref:Mesothelin n=1 Tax=Pontoporia blainvillei TaxID=48723 RepID=A0ABX0S8K7_PONBL|nr:mesothelin [Pontoporia blainvillei]
MATLQEKACPPGRKAQVLDESLVLYKEWELEACVDGALLAAQRDQVNLMPFTYQQLHIFKPKLDEGYPESLTQHLRYFFLWVTPEDIHKWNVTSLETVKSLLKVSKGHGMDAQVTGCGGGAPMEDLRVLSQHNINMDVATFKKLQREAVLPLTVAEVQKLLGANLVGLKAEEGISPLRDWISRQSQEDLDSLGLGLHGGTPNGYLVLDFNVQADFGGGVPQQAMQGEASVTQMSPEEADGKSRPTLNEIGRKTRS